MLGVVLWSDAKDGKAVFWCEDQGDLAYYETGADQMVPLTAFDPGDMVQFDVSTHQRLRRASNAKLVMEQAYSGLPETLRQNTATPANAGRGGKVIKLHTAPRANHTIQERTKRKA